MDARVNKRDGVQLRGTDERKGMEDGSVKYTKFGGEEQSDFVT
jgi:hypothetical protein